MTLEKGVGLAILSKRLNNPLFQSNTLLYRIYEYFLWLKLVCNLNIYPNQLLNPNTLFLLKTFFLWCGAILCKVFRSSLILSLLEWWYCISFLPWRWHILGQQWHTLILRRKLDHILCFLWAQWTLLNKQGSVGPMGLKWRKRNRKRNKQAYPPSDVIYNAHCSYRFFILQVHLKTVASL